MKEFVILSGQRSGSTLVIRSLDTSPDIYCAGEILHPLKKSKIHHIEWKHRYVKLGSYKATILLNGLFWRGRIKKHINRFYRSRDAQEIARGFKLMKSQLDYNEFLLPYLRSRGVSFIILIRDNDFDTALSWSKSQMTGLYHSSDANQSQTIEIPFDFFQLQLDRTFLENFAAEQNSLIIDYTDLIERWEESIASIGAYIGAKKLKVKKTLEKLVASERVRVTNLDELRERFDR
jgi:LPS sulfotransferase NodH